MSSPRSGLGLAGMRERVESLDGVFSLDSSEGEGLRVMISVPLVEEQVLR
jgi:signal transduction histidine kinase